MSIRYIEARATEISPYKLIFGRIPRLSTDPICVSEMDTFDIDLYLKSLMEK